MTTLYSYVGPPEIALREFNTHRVLIRKETDVLDWSQTTDQSTATFIIDAQGELWLADRRSEHVACARGGAVLSAGEITFSFHHGNVEATYVSNQSTGYCPRVESWRAVETALDNAAVSHGDRFDMECEFRRCQCGQITLVKDNELVCMVCGKVLPSKWNFARELS